MNTTTRTASQGRGPLDRKPSTTSLSVSGSSSKGDMDAVSLNTITSGSNQTFQEDKSMYFVEMNPVCFHGIHWFEAKPFISHNRIPPRWHYAPETLVLLHVIFSSHLEWKEVWPKLAEYHLLIPDLPCHSKSKNVCQREDFSIQLCTEYVADMIRAHAHDGRAHIVGISAAGGWTAMELARKYPELAKSVFNSGAWPVMGLNAAIQNSPRLIYSGLWTLLHSPAGKKNFFKASGLGGEYYNDELFSEIRGNLSSRLARAGISSGLGYEWLEEVGKSGVRILFVAAGAHDNPSRARKAGQVVCSQENGEAAVYTIPGAAHAWNLQYPALFAKGIRCWVERLPMPAEFKALPL